MGKGSGSTLYIEYYGNYGKVPDSFFLVVDLFLGPPCCPAYDVDPSDLYNTSEHQLKGAEDIQMEQMRVRLHEKRICLASGLVIQKFLRDK